MTSIIPHKLTSALRLKTSRGVHSIGDKYKIPALFTSPRIPAETKMKRHYLHVVVDQLINS